MAEQLFDSLTNNYKLKIDYSNFPPPLENMYFKKKGNKIDEISFSPRDFLYDIITCGMPHFWINKKANMSRLTEIQYKYHLMKTALEIDDDRYIIVSDKIKYLDSSERAFVSYYIGMFITKLVSREIFECTYLVHLGIVSNYKSVVRKATEPDLVGFTGKNDDYLLFEAKGRKISKKAMVDAAKKQLQSVQYISGIKPITGVVCVAHPIKEKEQLNCSMYDPTPTEDGIIDINKGELIYLYYLPAYELIKEFGNKETYCNISFGENNSKKIEFNLKISEKLFNAFKKYPSFNDLNENAISELLEVISNSPNENKDDLLTIELS